MKRLSRTPIALVALGLLLTGRPAAAEFPKPSFNTRGELLRPDPSYREWVYIGTPLTPNDLNPPEAPFPEFHNVYIHPADFGHWRRFGNFPNGTTIIKELVTVGSNQAVSGRGYFMGEFTGLEVAMKDSERFPGEPGHWAYFSFGHAYPLADSAEAFPAAACNSCHQASAADDFVFTQYYPVLRAARGAVTGRAMNTDSEAFQEMAVRMSGALASALEPTVPSGDVASEVPTDPSALFSYLESGSYKSLPASESARHPGRGPHTRRLLPVRVYMNTSLEASLAAGNRAHPAGSSAVKEMFDQAGELEGWAVMVKTDDQSAGGRGWFWYEVTSTVDGADPVAAGNGIPLCFGCHSSGDDFVLTDYPLQ